MPLPKTMVQRNNTVEVDRALTLPVFLALQLRNSLCTLARLNDLLVFRTIGHGFQQWNVGHT